MAVCNLSAITKASSESVAVAAQAVEHVNAVLCGDDDADVSKDAAASALAMATSFVDALVEVSATCYAGTCTEPVSC